MGAIWRRALIASKPSHLPSGRTTGFLRKFGIAMALQHARKEEPFIKKHLSKPYQVIWHELNGRASTCLWGVLSRG